LEILSFLRNPVIEVRAVVGEHCASLLGLWSLDGKTALARVLKGCYTSECDYRPE
jgi:hypothetical protein